MEPIKLWRWIQCLGYPNHENQHVALLAEHWRLNYTDHSTGGVPKKLDMMEACRRGGGLHLMVRIVLTERKITAQQSGAEGCWNRLTRVLTESGHSVER